MSNELVPYQQEIWAEPIDDPIDTEVNEVTKRIAELEYEKAILLKEMELSNLFRQFDENLESIRREFRPKTFLKRILERF